MNKWILVYDAGGALAIHTTEVEAETIADALAPSGLPPRRSGRVRYTATSSLQPRTNHREAVWGDGNKHQSDDCYH